MTMSQYETDRENQAVGPELCDECDHPVRLHADQYGCEFERGDAWIDGESMGAYVAQGPCGCMQHGEMRVTFASGQQRLGRALEAVVELLRPHLAERDDLP
jgi:hypothetical protein